MLANWEEAVFNLLQWCSIGATWLTQERHSNILRGIENAGKNFGFIASAPISNYVIQQLKHLFKL